MGATHYKKHGIVNDDHRGNATLWFDTQTQTQILKPSKGGDSKNIESELLMEGEVVECNHLGHCESR